MKRFKYLLLLISLLWLGVSFAQEGGDDLDTVGTTGILSYIEDLPDPANDEGLVRKVPFVEVIEEARLANCQDVGFRLGRVRNLRVEQPLFPRRRGDRRGRDDCRYVVPL